MGGYFRRAPPSLRAVGGLCVVLIALLVVVNDTLSASPARFLLERFLHESLHSRCLTLFSGGVDL
jgi:hypothetical protein